MNKAWKESSNNCLYYYDQENGLILGQAHIIAHTQVWLAKIYVDYNQEKYIGQYISQAHSQQAIERFWLRQENTLEYDPGEK